jgi:acyl carrier protein
MNVTKNDFLHDLKEAWELEFDLHEDIMVKEMDEWDSLNAMVLIAYVNNKFNIKLSKEDIDSISTVKSIMDKIGYEKFI